MAISMRMVPFFKQLLKPDQTSIAGSFFTLGILFAYTAFILYFSCAKSKEIAQLNKFEQKEKIIQRCEAIHNNLLEEKIANGCSKKQLEKFQVILQAKNESRKIKIKRGAKLMASEYQKYEPFVEDLKKNHQNAMHVSCIINLRRIVMLMMAMFIFNLQWLQLQIFTLLNLTSLTFIATVQPFQIDLLNRLNIFNELIGLLCAYFLLPFQDRRADPVELYSHGEFIVYILYACAAINALVTFHSIVKLSSLKLKQLRQRRYNRIARLKAQNRSITH